MTFIVTALFLAISVFARDFKDGQNFLTPVPVALMLPLSATMVPGIELNPWTAFVPIVNVALLIKALFLGEAKPEIIFLRWPPPPFMPPCRCFWLPGFLNENSCCSAAGNR